MTNQNALLDAALDYAWRSWFVLPIWWITPEGHCACSRGAQCKSGSGKHPIYDRELIPNGLTDATTDEDTIRAWWSKYPDANIGIVMEPSGLLAFDIDLYHSDFEKIEVLERQLGELPPTPTQQSGSGDGFHLLFRHPGGSVRGLIGGVVARSKAYIVVAPSAHRSGGHYQWKSGLAPDEVELAELPDAWKAALAKKAEVGEVGAPPEDTEPPWLRAIPHDKRVADMRAHLEREAGEVKGLSRPGTTFDVVRTAVRGYGVRDPEAALAATQEIYDPKCVPPWQERIGRHVASAYSKAHTPEWGSEYDPQGLRQRASPEHDGNRVAALVGADAVRRARDSAVAEVRQAAASGPSRDKLEIRTQIKARIAKDRRSTVTETRYGAECAQRVMSGIVDSDGADKQIRTAIHYAGMHAPRGSQPEQIAELLMNGASPRMTMPALVEAVGVAMSVAPAPRGQSALTNVDDLPEPEDDTVLRGQLLPGKEDSVSPCGANIARILQYSSETRDYLRFNDLSRDVEFAGGRFATVEPAVVDVAVKNWLKTHWQLDASNEEVGRQLLYVSMTFRRYNPVREYLENLVWDGVRRIGGAGDLGASWLTTYACAEDTPYARRVGAMFLISAVARGVQEVSKVDTVLILEGDQGQKKSTCYSILGGEWFCDTPLVLGDKDSYMIAGSNWIVELAELSSLSARDSESHKAFLSAQFDKFRPPYGKVPAKFNRHCVFGGTTNEWEYLDDPTGNRRYLAVRVGRVDASALRRDRDQIWAEAVARYCAADHAPDLAHEECPGERWWFEPHEEIEAAAVISERRREDPWVALISQWVERYSKPGPGTQPAREAWTMAEIAEGSLKIQSSELQRQSKAIARAFREAGLESTRGGKTRLWRRKASPE